jgi:hypothetical protein
MFVNPNLEGQYPLKEGTMTLGRMLQNAGYATGCFGKWGLGYPGSTGEPNKQGFDEFFGYNCQRQAHTYYPAFLWKNGERVLLKNQVQDPHLTRLDKDASPYDDASYRKFEQQDYANDLIFDELITFVDKHKDQPFFAMWTTPLPHVSLQAPQEWVDYYVKKFGDEEPYVGKAGYLPCRYPHATYAAMISYFDSQIGKLVAKLKEEGRHSEINEKCQEMNAQIITTIPKNLAYVSGYLFDDYINDMGIMQHFAMLNRKAMINTISIGLHLTEDEIIDQFTTIHNYIDIENMILRKGAVSAQKGEKLLIPINMRDGSLVCIGKGNEDWNCSAPHGAGRVMSRMRAKSELSMEEFKAEMSGIYSTTVSKATLDEAPMAYKTMDDIVENIGPTADIINIIKPIYNFKAAE